MKDSQRYLPGSNQKKSSVENGKSSERIREKDSEKFIRSAIRKRGIALMLALLMVVASPVEVMATVPYHPAGPGMGSFSTLMTMGTGPITNGRIAVNKAVRIAGFLSRLSGMSGMQWMWEAVSLVPLMSTEYDETTEVAELVQKDRRSSSPRSRKTHPKDPGKEETVDLPVDSPNDEPGSNPGEEPDEGPVTSPDEGNEDASDDDLGNGSNDNEVEVPLDPPVDEGSPDEGSSDQDNPPNDDPTGEEDEDTTPVVTVYTLTLEATEGGTVTHDVYGQWGTRDLLPGTEVTFTAIADECYHFSHWSNDDAPETPIAWEPVFSMTMGEEDTILVAHFDFFHPFDGGTGMFAEEPYLIANGDQLALLSGASPFLSQGYEAFGMETDLMKAHYRLTQDINLADYKLNGGWKPIGGEGENPTDGRGFTGTFEGDGKTISNLTIHRPGDSHQALFHTIREGAEVRNLNLLDPSVTAKSNAAALAAINQGTVTRVLARSSETPASPLSIDSEQHAGYMDVEPVVVVGSATSVAAHGAGLVALNGVTGVIEESAVVAAIRVTGHYAGLLVAENRGRISESYAMGNISSGGTNYQGGLVGFNHNGFDQVETLIENSYAMVILSEYSNYTGGVIGGQYRSNNSGVPEHQKISVRHVYGASTIHNMASMTGLTMGIGGVLGGYGRDMEQAYFDGQKFTKHYVKKGIPLSTNDMKEQISYAAPDEDNKAWDFDRIWGIDSSENPLNDGYPHLLWQTE